MRRASIVFFILSSLFHVVWAQGEKASAAPSTAKEKVVEVSQIQNFLSPFYYDRKKVRDPFEAKGRIVPLEPGRVYGPFLGLQSYPLSQYTLKGLLWQTQVPIAVFEDPKGVEHRLTVKDYIGENFGYIAMIRENEVVVIQTIEENKKKYSTTKVVFLKN